MDLYEVWNGRGPAFCRDRLFKKYEGIGISEYVTQQKIQLSKELLKEGKMKIYEIADLLGFESAFYFSKVFKKVTGLSPKDYRNQ